MLGFAKSTDEKHGESHLGKKKLHLSTVGSSKIMEKYSKEPALDLKIEPFFN